MLCNESSVCDPVYEKNVIAMALVLSRFGPAWGEGEGDDEIQLQYARQQPGFFSDSMGRLLAELVAAAARGKPPADAALAEYCALELRELNADESRAFMKEVYRKLRRMIDRHSQHA